MKQLIIILSIFFCGLFSIHGQTSSPNTDNNLKFVIKNNFASYFINSINLSFEAKIKNKHSIQTVVQLNDDSKRHSSWITAMGDQMITSGYSIGLEYRYYIEEQGNSLKGTYISPYFRYIFRDIYYDPYDSDSPPPPPYSSITFKRNVYTYGVIVGFQDVFSFNYLGCDFFAGLGIRHKSDYDFKTKYELYPINQFLDRKIEIRFGANLILSNIKYK